LGLERVLSAEGALGAAAFAGAGAAGIVLAGWATGSLEWRPGAAGRFPEYLGKAAVQQVLLCPFLAVRFRDSLGGRRAPAAACAAALFSLLHLPNGTLAASALALGFVCSWLYLRAERLLPVVLAHAVLGTAAGSLWSAPLLVSHRVGAMFFL
jgi:hypothetical protein